MFTLHKIKNLLKTLLYCFAMIAIGHIHNAYAGNGCGNENNAYAHYVDPTVNQLYKSEIIGNEDAATLALKQRYPELLKEINKLLYAACEASGYFDNFSKESNQEKFLTELGTYDLYMQKVAELKDVADKLNALPTSNECGEKHPFGCPQGQKCYKSTSVSSGGFQSYTTNSYTTYQCSEKDPGGKWLGVQNTQVENSGGKGSEYVSAGALNLQMSQTDADGKTTNTNVGMSALGAEGKLVTSHEYMPVTGEVEGDAYIARTNDECDIPGLKNAYLSTCYSCRIVGQMLEVFLAAAYQAFDVTSEAGIKLLTVGMFIWVAIYILKQISKFVQPEPMVMLQELFTFFFKCVVAYIAITSGLRIFTDLIINPILKTGADFGIAMVESVMPDLLKTGNETVSVQNNAALIDNTVMSRLLYLSKKVDNAVSINFVIGNAVTCHSTHAGAIQFAQKVTDLIGIKFFFPNVWLWICGIIIWVFAFMLVIGVNFYLLDIGFKIGFVLLLMPVALGLWPFASPFNKVFSALMKQIIHAAGIFAFLGVSTAMSISIISAAMGNTDTLLQAIQNNNTEYVSETFGLWSGSFILIIFAYLYSHKLISETVDKLTNKFFDGDMTGNSIHTMTVQAMDWCKSKVMAAAGLVAGVVTGGASSAAQMVGKAAVKTAVKTAASTARGVGRGVGAVARKFKRGNNN